MSLRRKLALAGLLLVGPACKDDAYAVVSVLTYTDSISAVAQFRVHVDNGADVDVLYYPRQPSESLTLDTSHPVTFSVQFSNSRGGATSFEIEPLNANGDVLGYGKADATIVKAKVFDVTVLVARGALRPEQGLDGGTATCDPYAPATACGAQQTCGLVCSSGQPAAGMCYPAGANPPGAACTGNSDCSPGSQCFTFSATGCLVMTCLRFCTDDNACGEAGAYCNLSIPCGQLATYKACSRPCDPTGTGTAGCASGLACFVYSDDTTDCACPGLGTLGQTCSQNQGCGSEAPCSGCSPGLSCVIPTGTGATTGICRAICKLASPACPAGASCHAFAASTRKVYGFCE